MKLIWCEKCRDTCSRRKHKKQTGDILELRDIITHQDGSREIRVWGRVNTKTDTILEFKPI